MLSLSSRSVQVSGVEAGEQPCGFILRSVSTAASDISGYYRSGVSLRVLQKKYPSRIGSPTFDAQPFGGADTVVQREGISWISL